MANNTNQNSFYLGHIARCAFGILPWFHGFTRTVNFVRTSAFVTTYYSMKGKTDEKNTFSENSLKIWCMHSQVILFRLSFREHPWRLYIVTGVQILHVNIIVATQKHLKKFNKKN